MALIFIKESPYFDTDQKNDLIQYLDFVKFRDIPASDTDIVLTVSTKFHQRPDLLSNELYGTTKLWWIFIVRNPDQMVDPIYDLVAGLDLLVPTKQRALNLVGACAVVEARPAPRTSPGGRPGRTRRTPGWR